MPRHPPILHHNNGEVFGCNPGFVRDRRHRPRGIEDGFVHTWEEGGAIFISYFHDSITPGQHDFRDICSKPPGDHCIKNAKSPPHQNATSKEELREQLFHQALQPITKETGTIYPCTQNDLDLHNKSIFWTRGCKVRVPWRKDPLYFGPDVMIESLNIIFPNRNKGPFVTNHAATAELIRHNDLSRPIPSAELTALNNLRALLFAVRYDNKDHKNYIPTPDLAIKIFSDLDLVFFRGELTKNVTVSWVFSLTTSLHRTSWGNCSYLIPRGHGHCHIKLNAALIFGQGWTEWTPDPMGNMIGTLLHEMCHAYAHVRNPWGSNDADERGDGTDDYGIGHGSLFGTRINVVHERAVRLLGVWAIEHEKTFRRHDCLSQKCAEKRAKIAERKKAVNKIKLVFMLFLVLVCWVFASLYIP